MGNELSPSHILLMFMSKTAKEQEDGLGLSIPENGKVFKNPLNLLLQSLGIYSRYFFDHYYLGVSEARRVKELESMIERLCDDEFSGRDAFYESREWEDLRIFSRELLKQVKVKPFDLPLPLPFDEWLENYELSEDAYKEYVQNAHHAGGLILPYE